MCQTKKIAEEEKDKESRGNNVIIYRVKEKAGTKEECRKHDNDFCMSLIKDQLSIDMGEDDIKMVFRIGKREQDATNTRPLLLQFRERSIKNRMMESLSKLKNCSDDFKHVSITHDLTPAERVECKTLVEQAKRKQEEETGEYIWRVRGLPGHLKIVRFRKQ